MSSTPRSNAEARRRKESPSKRPQGGKRRSWPRRILWTLLSLFVLGVAGLGVAYAMTDVPKPNEVATAQTSVVYYADGKSELARISEYNRESVELKQVPIHVQRAMLAAEDRNFYENQGISPTGIARAVWVAVKGGGSATQGGSTITQQYVKNYFLSQDRTLQRKAREILISVKIDGQQSKDQILENYLNTIYYGRGAYGIQTASKAYFNKDVSKITPAEGAFLASAIRGPSFYDPRLGAEQTKNAQTRSAYILDAMVTQEWLTPEQRTAAVFPKFADYRPPSVAGPNGHIVQLVKDELANKVKLTEADISNGGLRITTTIDRPKQQAAVGAIKERMPEGATDLNVGLVSIKPGDGAVQALYGGADYAKNQFNTATDATMQAGSVFKIFTLIAALQGGDLSIRNSFDGSSPQYFDEFANPGGETDFNRRGGVRNFNNRDYGRLTVPEATADSVNTVYAQLNILATPKKTAAAATSAGITTKLNANYANVLGSDSVKVIDMANAYATLAAKGVRATPYYVKAVASTDGSLDYAAKPVTKKVFDADLVSDVVYSMQQVVEGGSGEYAGDRLDREAAGKTGTSSDNYSAWFDGFTPQLATAVGMYQGDGSIKEENQMDDVPGWGAITGGTIPVRIWTDYMRAATEGMEKLKFAEPAYINKEAAPKRTREPERTSEPTPDTTPERTTEPSRTTAPTPEPTPTPTPTATATPEPDPTPKPKPTRTRPPKPTVPVPTPPDPTPTTGTSPQG